MLRLYLPEFLGTLLEILGTPTEVMLMINDRKCKWKIQSRAASMLRQKPSQIDVRDPINVEVKNMDPVRLLSLYREQFAEANKLALLSEHPTIPFYDLQSRGNIDYFPARIRKVIWRKKGTGKHLPKRSESNLRYRAMFDCFSLSITIQREQEPELFAIFQKMEEEELGESPQCPMTSSACLTSKTEDIDLRKRTKVENPISVDFSTAYEGKMSTTSVEAQRGRQEKAREVGSARDHEVIKEGHSARCSFPAHQGAIKGGDRFVERAFGVRCPCLMNLFESYSRWQVIGRSRQGGRTSKDLCMVAHASLLAWLLQKSRKTQEFCNG